MPWLSRVNFISSDTLSFTDVNNLGNDIRAWGDNVNGGGYTLSNVVLSASSGTMATVTGGTGVASTLTIRSTSGAGTSDAIVFQTGSQVERMRISSAGRVGIATPSPQLALHVLGTQGGPATSGTTPTGTARFVTVNSAMDIGSRSNGNTWMQVTDATNLALSYHLELQPNGGNVGITTTSPKQALHVAGQGLFSSSAAAFDPGDGAGPAVRVGYSTSGDFGYLVSSETGVTVKRLQIMSGTAEFITSGLERMRVDGVGVKIGGIADRATTVGSNQLVIFNGTAPVGTLANGASFYVTGGEMRVMDAAGNATLLSPHDSATNEWIYDSTHTPTGKRLRIRVEALMRFVDEHFGLGMVSEHTVA